MKKKSDFLSAHKRLEDSFELKKTKGIADELNSDNEIIKILALEKLIQLDAIELLPDMINAASKLSAPIEDSESCISIKNIQLDIIKYANQKLKKEFSVKNINRKQHILDCFKEIRNDIEKIKK